MLRFHWELSPKKKVVDNRGRKKPRNLSLPRLKLTSVNIALK